MQRVRVGLDLDGERGWHAIDALGVSTVGPLGLLTLLETQLGWTRVAPSQAERVVQMRECLVAARTGSRFYERSFEADEVGTAATLLTWRDQWLEHGWAGSFPSDAGTRLQDMAAIESLARGTVFPGVGQRLNDLVAALAMRRPQIDAIELIDPIEAFPLGWRRVLALLPVQASIDGASVASAPEGTFLGALQGLLRGFVSTTATPKVQWRDDGSVRLLRAASPLAAAQWLAAEIRDTPGVDGVLVVEQGGAMVDAALAAMDQPLLGLSEPSAFRPALQLLPLAMRLLWEPLDFKALMQFLTHPVGPLQPFARRRLAEKMAATPGVGGEVWRSVLDEIVGHFGDTGDTVREETHFWLEAQRFASTPGAPLEFVAARVGRLADLFRAGLAEDDPVRRAPAAAGYRQTQALAQALQGLQQQGVERLAPEALDRLVGQATAAGSEHPQLGPQAGARAGVRSASAVIDAFDEVIWWNMASVPLARAYPWSPRELEQLHAAAVELPTTGVLLERQARGWLRPLLAARRRLTLMLPREGEEAHPVWLMLSSLIEAPEVQEVDSLLHDESTSRRTTPVPHRPLPAVRRWWQLPAGAIGGWDRPASYSSLEQFFFNPYQWVLNYPARLKPSVLLELPGDFRLLGSLAHRVVERLYGQPEAIGWSVERVTAWFEEAVESIVREEGALLLMSGRRADLESFRQRFRESLRMLHQILRTARTQKIEPEKWLEGVTPLGVLRGSSDLLITLPEGRQAIIDMKWAGNKKYREKLEGQSHIQLAIYARLVEHNTGVWPAVAYFILKQPELLTTAEDLFPNVSPIRTEGASTALLWERVTATWVWRRAQLEAGAVELVFEDLEPTDASQTPAGALVIEPLDRRYNPFVPLAGWGRDA